MKSGESGQMAVELAVVLPVLLVAIVIAADCMLFVSECARFDNIAAQKTLALAVSPDKDSYDSEERAEKVRDALAGEFHDHGERVEVSVSSAGGSLPGIAVYELKLTAAPWPLGAGGASVFGVRVPRLLEHECRLAFDPYTPGQL